MITKEGKHYILCSGIKEEQSEKWRYKGTKIIASLATLVCRSVTAEQSILYLKVHLMKLLRQSGKTWEQTLFLGILWLGLEVGKGRDQRTAPSSHSHHPVPPRGEHRDYPESLLEGGNNTITDSRPGFLKRNLKTWE